ncbi:FAD-dependent oxidoreductase, partial [Kibdelosporangium lantanae]
ADRVSGVRVRDVEDGRETEIKANAVVNSTGVWTDELQRLSGSRGRFRVRASKGVHIVVPRDRIVSESGLILRTEKSVLFVIPWGSHWIVGTTDTDWNLDLAHPAARRVWWAGTEVVLSKTEFDLLELLVRNEGIVVDRATIYERIWGYEFGPTSKNLAVYIGYLRRKLEKAGAVDLIHTVRGVGYSVRPA